ncbi:MAG: putative peptide modification system cyclase, partial [Rhodanobacteraceae bacterium]
MSQQRALAHRDDRHVDTDRGDAGVNAILEPVATPAPQRALAPAPLLRTLVLCDLVDSTALVERLGDRRAAELFRRHDRHARSLVHQFGGLEIDKTDGFLMMFERPIQAVAFALAYQRSLKHLEEEAGSAVRARVGIHVGDIVAWDNLPEDIAMGAKPVEVEGLAKPITSRLMQLALPGQILLSGIAFQLAHRAQGELAEYADTALWRTHGRYRFKGLPDPIAVFEVGEEGVAPLKAPPWSSKAHRETPFWRRPATMFMEGLAILALVVLPTWYLLRPEPAIAFAKRDWVIVGDLKNMTGEASFDDSLETA